MFLRCCEVIRLVIITAVMASLAGGLWVRNLLVTMERNWDLT